MQIQCGIDIIEVQRIKNAIIELKDKFLNRVYTEKEIEYCEKKGINKYEHYAARFAAKEAIYKAISNKIKKTAEWRQIEILNDENGRPKAILKMDLDCFIDVSLSHVKDNAIATCIVYFM